MRGRLGPSGRQRGISLLEGILYLTLAASVIGFSATFLLEEQRRQEEIMIAREVEMVLQASQRFISLRQEDILTQLRDGAGDEPAALKYELSDLSEAGFLPAPFATGEGALKRVFGQELRLLVRAVLDSDPGPVRTTLSGTDITPDLVDGDMANDEARIEAVLFSDGPTRIPTQRAARITVRTERSNVGFITPPPPGAEPPPSGPVPNAIGPYGAFTFDVSGFSYLAGDGYPADPFGRFAALVALADPGVLDLTVGGGTGEEIDLSGFFRRCADILAIPGETEAGTLYQGCLSASNQLFTDIIFTSDTDADGVAETVRRISGPTVIEMGPPVDTDGDGIADLTSRVEGLQVIGCGPVPQGSGSENEFLIDCSLTRTAGDLSAEGDLTGQSLLIDGGSGTVPVISPSDAGGRTEIQVSSDRMLMRAEDQATGDIVTTDLHTGVYDVSIIPPGTDVEKPICPETTADGQFLMEPRIYVAPAAYANPDGFPSVGARAFAELIPAQPDKWRVRLIQYIAEDRCSLTFPESLPDNARPDACTTAAGGDNPDGLSDAYEVPPEFGRVLVITRCF